MYWGAFSTDIKKSSVNWTEAAEWMEKAVRYHNEIISTVVKFWSNRRPRIEIKKLPNCPEGDAFTFVFSHDNLKDLRQKVLQICFDIQYMLEAIRNDNSGRLRMKDSREFQTEDYFGGLYIRIGVAFSDKPPTVYRYRRYNGQRGTRNKPESMSYRGSVVYMSEEAEKRADYKLMPVIDKDPGEKFNLKVENETVQFDPSKLRERIKSVPSIKECMYEPDDEGNPTSKLVYRNIQEIDRKIGKKRRGSMLSKRKSKIPKDLDTLKKKLDESGYLGTIPLEKVFDKDQMDLLKTVIENLENMKEVEKEEINAIMIFVKYRNVLNKTMTENNPYMIKYILQEYEDIHQLSNNAVYKFIKDINGKQTRRTYVTGGLVKQKRDDSSMYVIKQATDDRKINDKDIAKLYAGMARLLSILPHDSSIGIAYGSLNEITYKDNFDEGNQYVDYFGECVNLAARMEFKDFSYQTKWGITETLHKNRIALSSKDTGLMRMVQDNIQEQNIPFSVNNVPLKWLNLGKDDSTIIALSSTLSGIQKIKIGDQVSLVNSKLTDDANKYKVLENRGLDLVIQRKGTNKSEIVGIDKLKL